MPVIYPQGIVQWSLQVDLARERDLGDTSLYKVDAEGVGRCSRQQFFLWAQPKPIISYKENFNPQGIQSLCLFCLN